MTNQVSNILESDVIEANDKMLGKESVSKKDSNNEVLILILFVVLIVGVAAYFEQKRNKEKNKLKIKSPNGETKEIDLNVTDSEIEKALETLKSK